MSSQVSEYFELVRSGTSIVEAKKKLRGNSCVNTEKGSGGGFTSCDAAGGKVSKKADGKVSKKAGGKVSKKADGKVSSRDLLKGKYKLAVTGSGRDGREKAAGKLIKGIEKSADICKARPPVCKKNLGLTRDKMPQLDAPTTKRFLKSYRDEGVKVSDKWMHVGQLKATQAEINATKVAGMAKSVVGGKFPNITDPIIVSRDGYILDGHHRWATLLALSPDNRMQVVQVDAPIKSLLKKAASFKGVERRGIKETKRLVLFGERYFKTGGQPRPFAVNAALDEAKKKLRGNLCVNTGQGSGGGFTACGGASGSGQKDALKVIVDGIKKDRYASKTEKENATALAKVELKLQELAGDTASRYMKADGSYTTARSKQHAKWVEKIDNPNAEPQETPTVIMFGGLPGSGKSSALGASLGMGKDDPKSFVANAVVVDSDRAKAVMPEYKGWNATEVHREASYVASLLEANARASKQNVILDGTFKDPVKMGKAISDYKKAGYRVEIRFADLPVAKSRERAVKRFLATGRYVPTGFIQSLKSGSSSVNRRTFDALKDRADGYMIMNTDVKFGEPAKLVAKRGKLI